MERKNVLVIEDESELMDVFAALLTAIGFDSRFAATGNEARQVLKEDRYRLLIIDLTLPDINGLDLYQEIIETYPHYRGQVVFTSGYHPDNKLQKVVESDGAGFISKPFTIDSFKEALKRWQ